MRYVVSVVEGSASAVNGGRKTTAVEASVLDSDYCFLQVAAFSSGSHVRVDRAIQRAVWHCEALNEGEERWEAA